MRLIASLFVALVLFAAAPAPARAQEVLGTVSADGVANVSGTRWEGQVNWSTGEQRYWTLYFRPDGVLEYGYAGSSYDNGRWLQNDALVVIHTNRYFAIMTGTLSGGGISGTMHNRRAASGAFSFVPQGGGGK